MCTLKRLIFPVAILMMALGGLTARAEGEVCDSVKIYFKQGKIDLLKNFKGNRAGLDRIADSLEMMRNDSTYRLRRILVQGAASPEGSVKLNKWLSEKRAGVLFNYLSRYGELPDSLKTTRFLGRDWKGLLKMAESDPKLPYREETLSLLREICQEVYAPLSGSDSKSAAQGSKTATVRTIDPLRKLQRLHGGVPYAYMYHKMFPELRASSMYLWYDLTPADGRMLDEYQTVETYHAPLWMLPRPYALPDTNIVRYSPAYKKPFYMALRSNLLFDAVALPNISAEFYLGKNISASLNWLYAWWKTDRRHRYWRAYGGDIAVRWWFGKAARQKPLTGHHLGVYGGIVTYDFEWGGKGYMGGLPGGNLWDKCNRQFGVEYGYSLPIARRLNLDFTVGLGYLGGEYREYIPVDDHYVWQATKMRHYFGPSKLEVSLVWLIGRGNYNAKKGGKK